jgi:zinc transporter
MLSEEHPLGLLWAYRFHGGEAETLFESPAPIEAEGAAGWVWAHFPLIDQRARLHLQRCSAPEDVRGLLIGAESAPRILFGSGWTYGVLPDFERDLEGHASEPARLRFAFDDKRLITVRRQALRVVDDMHRRLIDGRIALSNPLDAFVMLNRRYCEVAEDQIDDIAQRLDSIEDRVLGGWSIEKLELGPLRRELSRRHREISALRTAYHRAGSRNLQLQDYPLGQHLPSLVQQTEDVDREIITQQDRARLIHEEIDTRITGATNRTLRALTLMSALMMPPTLVVGAFGMNLHGILFSEAPNGFLLALTLCLGAVLFAYAVLWWMKLLK